MNLLHLIGRGLAYHRRTHAAVAAGTLLACAILTGALVVGDSVNRTLFDIATARLGCVAYALDWGNRFFGQDIAECLQREDAHIQSAAVLSLRGTAALPPGTSAPRDRVERACILGVDATFWRFAAAPTNVSLGAQEAAVSEAAARALGVKPGDDIEIHLARAEAMPLDAPLAGHERDNTVALLVTVKTVISDEQLGRFSLAANQAAPINVFLERTWLQEQVDLAGRANLLLAGGATEEATLDAALDRAWRFDHIGLAFRPHSSGVLQLESSRIFIEEEIVRAAMEIPGARPTLAYLADAITKDERSTPYSFVEAGPVPSGMPDDGVIINQWLSDAVGAVAGDRLDVAYRQLLPDNTFVEKHNTFTVFRVVPMEALSVERDLAPRFPGLSNVENCRYWDIGMPLDKERLGDAANEAYWRAYGQTPKLLTTFKAGEAMWGTRFGSVMGVRFTGDRAGEETVAKALRAKVDGKKLGLVFAPVRRRAIDGVNQAIDFGGLMVGMSTFLIGAALVLLGLLYVFGIQQRASEMGILKAVGYPWRRIQTVFTAEAFPAALAGIFAGVMAGVAYAQCLLAALVWLWPDTVAGTALALHIRWMTLPKSAGVMCVCAVVVILMGVRYGTRLPARELLVADYTAAVAMGTRRRGWPPLLVATLALAGALAAAAVGWLGVSTDRLGAFFGVGFLLLVSGLGYYAWFLGYLARRDTFKSPRLWKLAVTNLARRRGRSLGVAAATACGCFLVLSVSAMRENLALHADRRDSGTGGFTVYAETSLPLAGIEPRGGEERIIPLRVRDGDDAGCLNLNHAQVPRLIAADPAVLGALEAFAPKAFWEGLNEPLPDGRIPAFVGDTDTAMWGLKAKTGARDGGELPYRDESGQPVALKLVGCFPMRLSVFQGSVIISESAFTRLFPSESGYRAFLIDAPKTAMGDVATHLNREYTQWGMHAVPALERLKSFYAVESAYLAMFLVLGGLGLMLGSGGAGVIVLRNVYERRAEMALLQAIGYEEAAIRRMLLIEHLVLVVVGTVLGALAAAAAIVPLVLVSQTEVSLPAQGMVAGVIMLVYASAVYVALRIALRNVSCASLRAE